MKYIITESQYNKIIDRFLTHQFEPHEEKIIEKYPNSIFWVKNGEVIAEIEKSKFWIKFDIWNIISAMFSLEHTETHSVIKEWLEEHYEFGGLGPTVFKTYRKTSWKNIINNLI